MHILDCNHERIVKARKEMFSSILDYLKKSEGNIEVLQEIIDQLGGKPANEFSSPIFKSDLYSILRCYIWHSFFL